MLPTIGFLLAFFVGSVIGILGGGGSILAVPIMVALFGIKPELATVYSLFVVGITSLAGTFQNVRNRLVNSKTALLFALPAVASISFTRYVIMPGLPPIIRLGQHVVFEKNTFIMLLFGLLMILASIPMIRGQKEREGMKRPRPGILIVFGALIGFISGLVGAGGGFLIIPALSIFMKIPIRNAIATSVMIISINSLAGFMAEWSRNQLPIDWKFLGLFTLISIIGLLAGLLVSKRLQADKLKRAFGFFVLLIGIAIFLHEALS